MKGWLVEGAEVRGLLRRMPKVFFFFACFFSVKLRR